MISFNLQSLAEKKHKPSFSWLETGPNKRWHHKVIELLVFAFIVPVVGFFFFQNDPVGMNNGFPWFIIPPVLFAARYGAIWGCLLYTSPSPRDQRGSRMPSSA